ncbi:hypothetical protein HF521_006451 [Silurus meridionalis]|uniref:Uncharacterized protein n=1 Tax=Silurus meridionalis TaxID=175797 RepID=A0A8T0ATA8_SILME|nr:hypothetical protein HF521_006451 [Silurus meridionalis]
MENNPEPNLGTLRKTLKYTLVICSHNALWVASRVIQFNETPGSDIIIRAPAGFGKPNPNGQSTVTVSLRDENTNISVDVVRFIFSLSIDDTSHVELDEDDGGLSDEGMQDSESGPGDTGEEKNNPDDDGEASEEEFDPTAGPELTNSNKATPNPQDDQSDEDQSPSTSSQSDTRVTYEESDTNPLKDFETITTSDTSSLEQENVNESDFGSELQKSKVHTDQSDSTEPSDLHLLGKLTNIKSARAFTLIHEETTSAEANSKGTDPRSDISSVEYQTVPTSSKAMIELFPIASAISSSSEKETDAEHKKNVTDTTRLNSGVESTVKKPEVPPTPFFSGSDIYPEYVNDEWQNDPRYYDPYRNHPAYAGYDPYGAGYDPYGAGYDPYGAGYDPYAGGYDPYQAGYDPYQGGYDPYGESYDPYRAGYDPYSQSYDPYRAGYDPYGTSYDPYQKGYDKQDPYHETEREDPRHDVEQKTTPAYSIEENESRPTEISNNQVNSQSEEQPQSTFISPSSLPGSLPEGSENNIPLEEPSNSSSVEISREMEVQPSNKLPDPAVPSSEEGHWTTHNAMNKRTGSSSSEESAENTDSEQESQDPMDQPEIQENPSPAIQMSSNVPVVQVSHNLHRVQPEEEFQSRSPADLIPSFSSEEDDPLFNTIEHIMALAFNERSNDAAKNLNSTPSDNTISENNQNEESFSNESATESPGISAEVTQESVDLTTFYRESVPIREEDAFSENTTPNPNANLHITTQSSEPLDNSIEANANANTGNDSEESQESQIFTPSTTSRIANQPGHIQNTENSSDEENTRDRKSNRGIISQFPVETPAKILATNLWTSFLQALNLPVANQSGQSAWKHVQRSVIMMKVLLLFLFGSLTALPVSPSRSSFLLPLPQTYWRSPGRTHTSLVAPEQNPIPASQQTLQVMTPQHTTPNLEARTLPVAPNLNPEVPSDLTVTQSTELNIPGTPRFSTLTAPPSAVNISQDTSLPFSGVRGIHLKRARLRPRSAENVENNEDAENTHNDGENKRNTATSGKGKRNTSKGGTKAAAKGRIKETGNGQNAKTEKVQSADFSFEFDDFGWLEEEGEGGNNEDGEQGGGNEEGGEGEEGNRENNEEKKTVRVKVEKLVKKEKKEERVREKNRRWGKGGDGEEKEQKVRKRGGRRRRE